MMPRPTLPSNAKIETRQYRAWRGVNQTDSRVAIEDDELFWLENALTVGKGAIQILPAVGASVTSPADGVATMFGFTLGGNPVLIAVTTLGGLVQIALPSGTETEIAPAGTVTTDCRMTIWRDSPILIVDPVQGYFSWDGTTFTTIDAAQTGNAIAVFEARVWIIEGRTRKFSAPNDYDDFTAANGAGSSILTDEAFPGDIRQAVSAVEQLWQVGESAINAISNVQSSGSPPSVTTTFADTNIVASLGSNAPASVIGYFRALALAAPFGIYALSGVTPQKLSDKLDGLFEDLTLNDCPSAVAVVLSLPCLLFLVTYNGGLAEAGDAPLQMLLGFTQGKWFFAVQNVDLSWITTVVVDGVQQAWGTDGADVFQLFGADPDETETTYKVMSKLYDFGLATTMKAMLKFGFEYQATHAIDPTLTVDSELGSLETDVFGGGVLIFTNASGEELIFTNSVAAVLIFTVSGLVLSRSNSEQWGHYLGWTLTGQDRPYRVQATQFEYALSREWSTP